MQGQQFNVIAQQDLLTQFSNLLESTPTQSAIVSATDPATHLTGTQGIYCLSNNATSNLAPAATFASGNQTLTCYATNFIANQCLPIIQKTTASLSSAAANTIESISTAANNVTATLLDSVTPPSALVPYTPHETTSTSFMGWLSSNVSSLYNSVSSISIPSLPVTLPSLTTLSWNNLHAPLSTTTITPAVFNDSSIPNTTSLLSHFWEQAKNLDLIEGVPNWVEGITGTAVLIYLIYQLENYYRSRRSSSSEASTEPQQPNPPSDKANETKAEMKKTPKPISKETPKPTSEAEPVNGPVLLQYEHEKEKEKEKTSENSPHIPEQEEAKKDATKDTSTQPVDVHTKLTPKP